MGNIPNILQVVGMENEKSTKVKVIEEWIAKVSQSRPELGGFAVCPFASKAYYKIIECAVDNIEIFDGYEVVIYVIDCDDLDVINGWVEHYNNKYPDWLFFEDCATYDTFINGVQTNNGVYNLILGQPKEKLMKFREALKKTEYYSYWSPEYYDEIVGN